VYVRDRRYGEGVGVRAGNVEFHAGVSGEFGYDSNYTLAADNGSPNEARIDTFLLRITPMLSVTTLSGQRRESEGSTSAAAPKVTFRAGVSASYTHFFPTSRPESKGLADPPLGASGSLSLTILPQNPVSVDLLADFARTVQPSNNPDLNFDRFGARFGGGITWTPSSGMFDWRLGYEHGLTTFEDSSAPGGVGNPKELSNHSDQINTRGRWRFLPRTALMYDATATFVRYNTVSPGQLPSDPIRARIGINGLVTSSFALLAMAGWGSSFYKGVNAQQFDGIIAQAELKWFLTPNTSTDVLSTAMMHLSTISVGYVRDFANSYLGDYYLVNRGYANFSFFLSQAFVLSLAGGVSFITYPVIYDRTNHTMIIDPGFTTPWTDVTLFGEYRPTDILGLNATLRFSNAGEHLLGVAPFADELKWTRYEAYVGARLFF
jgi:hypothetical protein